MSPSPGGGRTAPADVQLAAVQKALQALGEGVPRTQILAALLDSLLELTGSDVGLFLVPSGDPDSGGHRYQPLVLRGQPDTSRFPEDGQPIDTQTLGENSVQVPLHWNSRLVGYAVWSDTAGQANNDPRPFGALLDICAMILGNPSFQDYARRAQEAERSLSSFKKILDNTLDMIFMFDPLSLKFVYLNQGALQAMGYEERELLQLRPCDIKPEYPEARFRKLIQPLLDGRNQALFFETRHRRKDGSEFPVDVLVQYMPGEGDHGLFVNIVRDLTERRRLDQMKREFVSTVSHELRTPLTSIQGALGLLGAGAVGQLPDKARRLIDIAHKNSSRLVRLINDILDIEKVEAGKMIFHMREHRLDELMEQAIAANRSFAEQYQVDLHLDNRGQNLRVRVDEDRFSQILANLISNAAKFSPPGGQVRIEVARQGGQARIQVIDRGPGIAPEVQRQLFQKFVQADSSDARSKGGTGLGLSIVKALTEQMGGRVAVQSAPGEGTRFTLDFPCLSESGEAAASPEPDQEPDRVRMDASAPYPVLVVEDDPDVAELLRLMLEQHHLPVEAVQSLERARQKLSRYSYQAVILDLRLPDGHGLELIPQLRALPGGGYPAVIVVSAYVDESRTELQASGIPVENWLSKPVSSDQLLAALKRSGRNRENPPRVLYLETDIILANLVRSLVGQPIEWDLVQALDEAGDHLARKHYDTVIVDLDSPGSPGRQLLSKIQSLERPPPVLVLSRKDIDAEQLDAMVSHLQSSQLSSTRLMETLRHLIAQSRAR